MIEDYCILGVPPRGQKEGDLKTSIGSGAHFRSHTVVYAGNRIGINFQTGNKVNIRELNEIGDNVSIGTLSVIEHHVKIGEQCKNPQPGFYSGVFKVRGRRVDRPSCGINERQISAFS